MCTYFMLANFKTFLTRVQYVLLRYPTALISNPKSNNVFSCIQQTCFAFEVINKGVTCVKDIQEKF